METAALVASIVSIIIGGFAIWLSVTFYRMSNKISEDTKEASKGISSSVNRLESLFDTLYSDTFSMMKETVTDMRKHMWPEKGQSAEEQKQIEEKANAKIAELQNAYFHEIKNVLARVGKTDSKIDEVEKNLEKLVERAIQGTRKVESEAQEEKSFRELKSKIGSYVMYFDDKDVNVTVAGIVKTFKYIYSEITIMTTLKHMIRAKELFASDSIDKPNTFIRCNW
ncbi:MAG: hypothetical protein GY845_16490 [Planctomycetes bacterium]|nr:hypothetical protein [Planctomycetota bacterium]